MAIFTTDFSEYTTSSPLSDWTDFWGTGDFTYNAELNSGSPIAGTKWLNYISSASTRQVVTWDDVGSVSDCDLLGLFVAPIAAHTGSSGVRLHARVGGAGSTEDSYHVECIESAFRIVKYISGTGTVLTSEVFDLEETGHYWIRFKVSSTALKAKIWDASNIEPNDWLLETTDSSLTAGRVGIGVSDLATDFQCDYFEAATSTDVVTSPPTGWVADTRFGPFNLDFTSFTVSSIALLAGGNFPVGGKTLTGFRIYVTGTHSSQVRCAVYSGGSASDPDGATLLHDFGETTGSDINQWLELSGADVSIPQGSFLWVAVKGTGGFSMTRTSVGNAGNMQVAQGTSNTSGLDETPSVAWPGSLTSLSWATSASYYVMEAVFVESSLTPPTGSLAITGSTPAVAPTPASGAITFTTGTPVPGIAVPVYPSSGVLTLTGSTPTPIVAVPVFPPTDQIAYTGFVPLLADYHIAAYAPAHTCLIELADMASTGMVAPAHSVSIEIAQTVEISSDAPASTGTLDLGPVFSASLPGHTCEIVTDIERLTSISGKFPTSHGSLDFGGEIYGRMFLTCDIELEQEGTVAISGKVPFSSVEVETSAVCYISGMHSFYACLIGTSAEETVSISATSPMWSCNFYGEMYEEVVLSGKIPPCSISIEAEGEFTLDISGYIPFHSMLQLTNTIGSFTPSTDEIIRYRRGWNSA